ncbi:MAG: hypothetical protein NTU53_10765 [Planctomycetota bacterium]|nr:hypothetical protein [Planctomycetota bacterium]
MHNPPRSIFTLMAAVLLIGAPARAEDSIAIDKRPVKVQTVIFDPADPPNDMPKLAPQEAAVTRSTFGAATSVEVQVVDDREEAGQTTSTVKITAVNARLAMDVVIWLPEEPAEYLVAHEQGHRGISELFYKDAEQTMRKLAAKYIGQAIRGKGPTANAARQDAMRRVIGLLNADYMAATQVPSARVNAIFDKLTAHGRNKKLSVETAIRQSIEQYRDEQKKK